MVVPSLLSSDHQTDLCVTDKANRTLNRDEYLMGAGITVCIIPYRLMSRQQLTGRAARHLELDQTYLVITGNKNEASLTAD